jgi:hypothetical protein
MEVMRKKVKPRASPRKNSKEASRTTAQISLTRAFTTFTQAAGSLEKSYQQLQSEVVRLHQELRRANAELEKSVGGECSCQGISIASARKRALRDPGSQCQRTNANHQSGGEKTSGGVWGLGAESRQSLAGCAAEFV